MRATNKPFKGLVMNTENYRLAEIWITEQGIDHEFVSKDFTAGTGINPGSVSRLLNVLVEKGVLACYQHPRFAGQSLFRVAWPVLVKRKEVEAKSVPSDTVPTVLEPYDVSLSYLGHEVARLQVEAASPLLASELARASLRVEVSRKWQF